MDLISLIVVLAGVAGILTLLYIAFIGQRTILEWWQDKRAKKKLIPKPPLKPPTPRIPHNLPQPSEFLGRKEEIAEVKQALASRLCLVTIDGIAGIGKTALALEVAHELLWASETQSPGLAKGGIPALDAFIWTTAKDRDVDLSDIIDTIACTLDYPYITQLPPNEKLKEVAKLLEAQHCLIIVDNFETITDDAVADFLLALPQACKALVTSRYVLPTKLLDKARRIPLERMDQEEALSLIRNEGKRLGLRAMDRADEKSLLFLYEETGGTPLAIKWAVGQLTQPAQSLSGVLESLRKTEADIYEGLFARSWFLLSEPARGLLMAMSIFASSASKATLETVSGVHGDAFIQALSQLTNMRLMEVSPELEDIKRRYSIHPLLRNFAQQQLHQQPANTAYELIEHFVTYFSDYAERQIPSFLAKKQMPGQQWEVRIENISDTMNWAEAELDNISAAMDWCYAQSNWKALIKIVKTMGYFYATYGYWNERIRRGHQGVEAARKLGDRKSEAWMYVNELGYMMIQQARYKEAEKLIRKGQMILEEEEKILADRADIQKDTQDQQGIQFMMGLALRYLGILYTKQSKYEVAQQFFERAMAIFERLVRRSIIANQMTEMGMLALRQNNYQLAERYYKLSLSYHDSQKARKPWVYSWMARAYLGLGDIAYQKGGYDKARKLYAKGLECSLQARSKDGVAYAKYRLGVLEEQEHRYAMAFQLARESYQLFQRMGGREHVIDLQKMIERLRPLVNETVS